MCPCTNSHLETFLVITQHIPENHVDYATSCFTTSPNQSRPPPTTTEPTPCATPRAVIPRGLSDYLTEAGSSTHTPSDSVKRHARV